MKLILLLLLVSAAALLADVPSYHDYWYVYADGQRIDLPIGHASPLVTDWDSDGDKDLFVGRFQGGNIMVYTNDGPMIHLFLRIRVCFRPGEVILPSPQVDAPAQQIHRLWIGMTTDTQILL